MTDRNRGWVEGVVNRVLFTQVAQHGMSLEGSQAAPAASGSEMKDPVVKHARGDEQMQVGMPDEKVAESLERGDDSGLSGLPPVKNRSRTGVRAAGARPTDGEMLLRGRQRPYPSPPVHPSAPKPPAPRPILAPRIPA